MVFFIIGGRMKKSLKLKVLKKQRIAVLVGHNSKKTGVFSGGIREWNYNRDLAKEICTHSRTFGILSRVFYRTYDQEISREIGNAYREIAAYNPDMVLDLHCNGFIDPGANGCEMLTNGGHESTRIGESLCDYITHEFGTKNRGAKILGRHENGGLSVYAYSDTPACAHIPIIVCEPFFLTNPKEREMFCSESGRIRLARAILSGAACYWHDRKKRILPWDHKK